MTHTISGTINTVVTLNAAAYNPTTITATGLLNDGLEASYTGLTLVNAGRIAAGPGGFATDVLTGFSGASITNQAGGTISGTTAGIYASGTVTVLNAGSIAATGTSGAGVDLLAGGSVTNQSGGTISAYAGIIGTSAAVAVVNGGSIAGGTTGAYGTGIDLLAGGSVTNDSGGAISGYDAIFGDGAAVALTNDGAIAAAGTYGRGVELLAGGSVTNQSGGTIGGFVGVYGTRAAVSVVNDGRIAGNAADSDSAGVVLIGGGSVTNAASASITGVYQGVYSRATTTVVNDGVIASTGTSGEGVDLDAGGTLTNAGTIAGVSGTAVYFGGTGGNLLVLDPRAVVLGRVEASGHVGNALDLASASGAGTLAAAGDFFTKLDLITVAHGASWELANATVLDSGGLTNDGQLLLDPSTLLVGSLTGTGSITMAAGSTLIVQGTVTAGETIAFAGPGAVLELGDPAGMAGTIVGYGSGDVIDSRPGTMTNHGTIAGTSGYGILFGIGGSVTNAASALITGSYTGVFISGGAGSVVNDGSIGGAARYGINLRSGGSVTNAIAGTITGGRDGLYLSGGGLTVMNAGVIADTGTSGAGVFAYGGGSVTNQSSAVISGYNGVYGGGAALTVINAGSIAGDLNRSFGSAIVLLAGGSVTNQSGGAISGFGGIVGYNSVVAVTNAGSIAGNGSYGAGVYLGAGGSITNQSGAAISGDDGIASGGSLTVVNDGGITGNATSSSGFGVVLDDGGSVTNQSGGTISGYDGVYALRGDATVVNAGSISGTLDAVVFYSGSTSLLIDDPGAAFSGTVNGGNAFGGAAVSTLELASGASAGTLSGLGTQFIEFGQISVDAGASWTLAATGSVAYGVRLTDAGTLTNSGSLDITVTLAAGGVVSNASSGTISGFLRGIYSTQTAVAVVNAGSISGSPTSSRGAGVDFVSGGTVTSQHGAAISGYDGISGGYSGDGLTVLNAGAISGSTKGFSGTGVRLGEGGSVTNQSGGSITGYNGIVGGNYAALTVVNAGVVAGVTNGTGIELNAGGGVTNLSGGTISGYRAIYGARNAVGLVNAGSITGSTAGNYGTALVLEAGGDITNQSGGLIAASVGIYGGNFNASINVVNAGSIVGASTADVSGTGILLRDGGSVTNQSGGVISGSLYGIRSKYAALTVENAGSISGANEAVQLANGYTNLLVVDPGAVFTGVVDGGNGIGGFYVSTLELSGTSSGTLSGIGTQFVNFAQTTIDAGAAWTLTGSNTFAAGTSLTNSGTLTVLDTALSDAGAVVNDGTILIDPSVVTLASLTGSGTDVIESASTLDITGAVSAGETIVFSGGSELLGIDPTAFSGQIDGITVGGTIELTGVSDGSSAGIVNGNTLEIQRTGNSPVDLTLDPDVSYVGDVFSVSPGGAVTAAPCFLRDTLIRTETGETAVQDLAVGDRVVTLSGEARPITWIGYGRVLVHPRKRSAATPVIIRKGALADNVPHRDLRITKGHALFVDGVLIPAEFLINHRSILWDDHQQTVEFYHIELATHAVLVANGAASESYRDDGNRWLFQNANSGWEQPPKMPCAPVLTGGPIVDAAWRRLLDRSGPRPRLALTDDADLHLLVDGVRLDAAARVGDAYVFKLARTQGAVRIVSRASVPQELGLARDARCLGVAVRRIVVRQMARFRMIEAEDQRLEDGFHMFEAGNSLRWTDGDAILPAPLFEDFAGAAEVVLHLGGSAWYPAFCRALSRHAA